jgi:hypothetical protein
MDRGKRPASRLDDLDFPDEIYGRDPEKNDYCSYYKGISIWKLANKSYR